MPFSPDSPPYGGVYPGITVPCCCSFRGHSFFNSAQCCLLKICPKLFYGSGQHEVCCKGQLMQLINSEQLMKVNGHGREKLERKTFPAVGEAHMAIFWSAPGFKGIKFVSSGFSTTTKRDLSFGVLSIPLLVGPREKWWKEWSHSVSHQRMCQSAMGQTALESVANGHCSSADYWISERKFSSLFYVIILSWNIV